MSEGTSLARVHGPRAVLLGVLIVLLSLPVGACAQPTQRTGAAPAPGAASAPAAATAPAASPAQGTVAVLLKNLVNPYFVNMQRGAEMAGKQLNVQVRTLAPSKPDNVEEQIQLLESVVQARVDAIVLVPVDSNALVPAVNAAKSGGIPVFTADTRLIGTEVMTFVGTDHVTLAKLAAQHVVDWANRTRNGRANVLVLEGVPGASSTVERGIGFKQVFDATPNITVLAAQTANYNRVQAANVTENLLTRHPNADVVLAMNDEMALGAIEAIKARGKTPNRDIYVVGINAAANAIEAMEKGELAATVYANEYCMAWKSVELAVAYVRNGTPPPPEVTLSLAVLVTPDNLAQFKALREQQAAGAECKE
ncbi:MAG TPA: sugar ABC transporter substrate-binding protein [Chloroflexota bacterium]|nr:sugar ABC transporter substrate-binding protein [Chloroflexota bacterium]